MTLIKWGITLTWLILINGIIIPHMLYGVDGPTQFGALFGFQVLMSPILGVVVSIFMDEYFDV